MFLWLEWDLVELSSTRSEAFRKLDCDKFVKDMSAIPTNSACRDTMDEAPDAYKNPEDVFRFSEASVHPLFRLIPVANYKDGHNNQCQTKD